MPDSIPEYLSELQQFEASCKEFIDWQDRHREKRSDSILNVDFDEFRTRVQEMHSKEEQKTIDIYIFGTSSAGRFTLMNALLHMKVMRSGVGHRTPCAVRIQSTDRATAYRVKADGTEEDIDLSSEESVERFMTEIDNVTSDQAEGTIHLYVPKQDIKSCSILAKNASLTDQPDIERPDFEGEKLNIVLETANALILVIDITGGLNDQETRDLLQKRDIFVKPNVVVALNKCDVLDRENAKQQRKTIEKAIDKLSDVLSTNNESNRNRDEIRKSIFVISAKEVEDELNSGSLQEDKAFGADPTDSFGYDLDEAQYVTSKNTRSLGYKNFEAKLLSIASGNYEKEKAEHMLKTISDNRVALIQRAKEEKGRLLAVIGRFERPMSNHSALDEALKKAQTAHERELEREYQAELQKIMEQEERDEEEIQRLRNKVNMMREFGEGNRYMMERSGLGLSLGATFVAILAAMLALNGRVGWGAAIAWLAFIGATAGFGALLKWKGKKARLAAERGASDQECDTFDQYIDEDERKRANRRATMQEKEKLAFEEKRKIKKKELERRESVDKEMIDTMTSEAQEKKNNANEEHANEYFKACMESKVVELHAVLEELQALIQKTSV